VSDTEWLEVARDAYRAEALEWDRLVAIFDAIFGSENRRLPSFPEVVGFVSAAWIDSKGVEHEANTLAEVQDAYTQFQTAEIRFSSRSQSVRAASLLYRPGAQPPSLHMYLNVHPEKADAIWQVLEAEGFRFMTTADVEQAEHLRRLESLKQCLSKVEAVADVPMKRRPQVRGQRFEPWLGELFETEHLESTLNVQNKGEQIDFTFWVDSLFVIGEARWLQEPVDEKQLRDFFGKLHLRPAFVVGLVISMSGFTAPARELVRSLTRDRTILTMTRSDLEQILSGQSTLRAWLRHALRERLEHP
jgi:hypothetical protein